MTPQEAYDGLAGLQLVDVREHEELLEARVDGGIVQWARVGLPLSAPL